jgi:MFS family permease
VLSLLRRNRDYRLVLLAQIVSFAGDWFATVAFSGLVLDRTHNDLLASLVFVVAALPAFLMTPLAGPVADRFDRKRVMVACSFLQSAAALLFLLSRTSWIGWGFVAQALITAIGAFFGPASQAAITNLVAPEDLSIATAASSSVWGAMLAIGSGLGALVASTFGRATAFWLDAASFVVSGALLLFVKGRTSERSKHEPRPRMRPIHDTVEALKYARGNPFISAFLMSKGGFGLGTGVVGLLSVLATKSFHRGDGGTGMLLAARGLGVLLGPWFVRIAAKRGLPAVVSACGIGSITYGFGYLIVPSVPSIYLASIAVFTAHLGGGAQWSSVIYGIAKTAPDKVRGRINAADFAIVTLTMSISLTLAGYLSLKLGPKPVMYGLAIVQLSWGSFFLYNTRKLRTLDPESMLRAEEASVIASPAPV